ncbi:angiogenin-2-like [Sander lucioperca]|uniref:angiogenin-2-like n=1 Tax=Sander lucioperca TaxID=283035 RepID=UPI00125DB912|nr:angiogenin-2-like [Sander lucioperca]
MEEFSDFSISLSCHSGISPAADSRTHLSPVIQINMKISIFAGVLLISAALMFLGPETADAQNNNMVIGQMNPADCTQMMNERFNIDNQKDCRNFQRFVIGNFEAVRVICGDRTRAITSFFKVVECTFVEGKSLKPPCVYKGKATNKRIAVKCVNGNPTNFEIW